MTPLARQEQSRSLEELRERAWALPWPIVEAAALLENKVGSKFTREKDVNSGLKCDFRQSGECKETLGSSFAVANIPFSSLKSNSVTFTWYLPHALHTDFAIGVKLQDLLVDIYWRAVGSSEPPRLLGSSFLLPDTFKHSLGQIEIPVTSPK